MASRALASARAGVRQPAAMTTPPGHAPVAPPPVISVPSPVAAVPEPMPPSLLAMPLVWFNAGADVFLRRLGPPGRFLTTTAGRNLLGWGGLLMCIAAAGIVAREAFGIGL